MPNLTTEKIKEFIDYYHLDFNAIENKALNDYLTKIFPSCPFTDEPCTQKQCCSCNIFQSQLDRRQ